MASVIWERKEPASRRWGTAETAEGIVVPVFGVVSARDRALDIYRKRHAPVRQVLGETFLPESHGKANLALTD